MAEKKAFVVRLKPEVLKAVEIWAADEFRSTNGQLEFIISQALKKARRYPRKSDHGHSNHFP
ncbi:MAG TPA: hypothetical protein PKH94_09555 [Bacteroidales bacterium]|nr:hypothetical protein [Bacteroidales bacterium]HNS47473.1 hypothetical protein [Bacteroidales bacterium]